MPLNRPTASELLDAAHEFYAQQSSLNTQDASGENIDSAAPATPQQKYHALIAQHVLKIVHRELELKAAFEKKESQLLGALLDEVCDLEDLNKNIIKKINCGYFDILESKCNILINLKKIAILKLEIDNPKYPTYLKFVN